MASRSNVRCSSTDGMVGVAWNFHATSRTAAYHVGADIFAGLKQFHPNAPRRGLRFYTSANLHYLLPTTRTILLIHTSALYKSFTYLLTDSFFLDTVYIITFPFLMD